jgi:hypothetical protein
MEFGKPEANQSGRIAHGEWHLWLYMCSWRIETQRKVLAGSEDDGTAIEAVLKEAHFDAIRVVSAATPSHDLAIEFNSGTKVFTFSSSSSHDQEQWMLFVPDGNCLTIYGDGSFEYTPRNQPRGPRS